MGTRKGQNLGSTTKKSKKKKKRCILNVRVDKETHKGKALSTLRIS